MAIQRRLKYTSEKVSSQLILWRPTKQMYDHDEAPRPPFPGIRRTLLFHFSEILDKNECGLDFLNEDENLKKKYLKQLNEAVVREAIEFDESLAAKSHALRMMFICVAMLETNQQLRREVALRFNRIAKAALSTQA